MTRYAIEPREDVRQPSLFPGSRVLSGVVAPTEAISVTMVFKDMERSSVFG